MDETWHSIPVPSGEEYGSAYPAEALDLGHPDLSLKDEDYPRLGVDGSWVGTPSATTTYAFGLPPRAYDGQTPCYGSYVDSISSQTHSSSLSRGSYSSDGGLVVADSSQQAQSLMWPITPPTNTDTQSLSSTADLASAQAVRAGKDKGPRKRGRPRLYDEDGTRRERGPPTKVLKSSTAALAAAARAQSPPSKAPYPLDPGRDHPSIGTASGSHPRRRASKDEATDLARIRDRNKMAASRYRQKTQESIARAEEEERIVAGKRQTLLAQASQLREEVFHLKNELLHQASCGCPLIQDYLSRAAAAAPIHGVHGVHGGGILTSGTGMVRGVGCLIGVSPPVTSPDEYQSLP
ncbi:hypothetical protein QBC47DRAFT_399363 [Echria macrotheca]|uniref:BZIP domain-containing protein n=1 Tax=Echria macrotheca TaxID=438768 RepID=A0AAJ0FE79_9PEZI|nr:hypothetical protein QBC47DRAFT_399363 [Echria macrotheca]